MSNPFTNPSHPPGEEVGKVLHQFQNNPTATNDSTCKQKNLTRQASVTNEMFRNFSGINPNTVNMKPQLAWAAFNPQFFFYSVSSSYSSPQTSHLYDSLGLVFEESGICPASSACSPFRFLRVSAAFAVPLFRFCCTVDKWSSHICTSAQGSKTWREIDSSISWDGLAPFRVLKNFSITEDGGQLTIDVGQLRALRGSR